jgi:hypothetical protein
MTSQRATAGIDVGRMLVTPASEVYDYLKGYAAGGSDSSLWTPNSELEQGLLQRNDPLIDLGLAQYAGEKEVWKHLHKKAYQGPQNEQDRRYQRSLRIACFSNELQGRFLSRLPEAHLNEGEIKALVADDECEEELAVLLSNRTVDPKFVIELFKKEGVFEHLEEYKHLRLVHACAQNPLLATDTSNEHGPDMYFWDLQRAVVHLLRTAPVNMHWLLNLHWLLGHLMRGDSHTPDDSIEDVLERWSKIPVEKPKAGWDYGHTDEDSRDETLCMMAALYGHYHEKKSGKYERIVVGDLNSPQLAYRCAAYACMKMMPQQVREAVNRDGSLVVLAAIRNTDLLWNKEVRAIIEQYAHAFTAQVYRDRCLSLHRRRPLFDPRPVSEVFPELIEDGEEFRRGPELAKIDVLEQKLTALTQAQKEQRKLFTVGFVALAVLIWLSH